MVSRRGRAPGGASGGGVGGGGGGGGALAAAGAAQVMPGGTPLFAAGAGAAVGVAALVALWVAWRGRGKGAAAAAAGARAAGRGGLRGGKGAFAVENPLGVRRATGVRPPAGPPPRHSRVGFAEYHGRGGAV